MGTITIPEDDPATDPGNGGEEASECLPMMPLGADCEPQVTMPYLEQQPSARVRQMLESNVEEHGTSEDCGPDSQMIYEGQFKPSGEPMFIVPFVDSGTCHPHPGCTQPQVCPYSGPCVAPQTVPHCESNDEHPMQGVIDGVKDAKGEESSEPMPKDEPKEEPKDESNQMGPSCPGMGCDHYHHGNYPHQIVCPYTGKSYPVDEDPCEPMKTEPEIKAEEQQEATPAEQPKPEKKPETRKSRKVRYKLHLLESDPPVRQNSDTLEFRPSDAQPNEFDRIPF
jgi:hypothetical protein